jgi:hypothetical protein
MRRLRALLLSTVIGAIALASPVDAAWRAVCREDTGRLCPPNQEPRAMLQCLQQHRADLSALCAKSLPQPKPTSAKQGSDCSADVERFCKGLTGRPAAILQCLKGHEAELSEACRASLAKTSPAVESAVVPCADDFKRFCADVAPQAGARNKCLLDHKSEVSRPCLAFLDRLSLSAPPCRADVERLSKGALGPAGVRECLRKHDGDLTPACRAYVNRPVDPCRGDTERLCKGVIPGDGRVIACLKQHQSELSSDCARRLVHAPAARPE